MKKLKLYTFLAALAVIIAGVLISLNVNAAYAERAVKPWNVTAQISCGNDVFSYDLEKEIKGLESEADERGFYLGCNGKKRLAEDLLESGLPPESVYNYLLPNFDNLLNRFGYVRRNRVDCEVTFSKNGFRYSEFQDGVEIDAAALFNKLIESRGRHIKTELPIVVDKAVTAAERKRYTVKKGSFTTTYNASGANRCHNIALATSALNGVTVEPNQEFSFNGIVGERSEKNGYKNAKVIMDGSYVDGLGGGVCQVSTTLYNALLLSGIIPKASQHSLVSSYIMAGFDAMVTYGSADLSFVNTSQHSLYIQGKTSGKTVTFTIYGEPNEYSIVRENAEERTPFDTVEIVDEKKYPELIYTDQIKVITNGSDGVKTKSYLKYYKNGVLVNTRLIRQNVYKRVNKVIARGSAVRAADEDVTTFSIMLNSPISEMRVP